MFFGNKNLRKVGEKINYNQQMLNEIIKCKEDIIYFAENYFYIVHPDRGKIKIVLYDWQKKILKSCVETPDDRRHLIIRIPRQQGKTTIFSIYLLWYSLFNKDKTIAICAHKLDASKDILKRIKLAIQMLPVWLQQGLQEDGWNKTSVIFENGSRLIAAPTSPESLTSFTINLLFLDEFAKVPQHIAEEFITSTYPVITAGLTTKIVICSCVNKNTFVFSENGLRQVCDFIDENKKLGYEISNYKIVGMNGFRQGNVMFNNGKTKTRIINTTFGEFEGSLNHKMWACKNGNYGWYKMADLSVGDFISLKYGMNVYGDDDNVNFISEKSNKFKYEFNCDIIDTKMAYFLGLFLAKGSNYRKYNKNGDLIKGTVQITCGDDVSKILKELNMNYYFDGKFHYNICYKDLILFLEHLGFNLDLKSKEKYIPNKLLSISRKNTIALLSGIFDGDGYSRKDKGLVGISMNSKKIIMQIKMLLLNLGIITDYLEIDTKPTLKVSKVTKNYRLLMDGENSKKFYDIIGFKFERKQEKQKYLKFKGTRNSHDIIPFSFSIIKNFYSLDMRKLGIFKGKQKSDFSRLSLLSFKQELKKLNINELNEFLDDNVKEDMKWFPIKSIKDSENEVFDFSLNHIDDDKWCHSVLYNGYVGHQTPKGMNHFYEFWRKAIDKDNPSNFYPIRIGWWENSDRNDGWKEDMLADIGPVRFSQEYSCNFLGSQSTLIDSEVLERIPIKNPIATKWTGIFLIYRQPVPNRRYIVSVDTGKGTGKDYSVAQVIEIENELSLYQAAVYRNNLIIPHDFSQVVVSIAKYYNNAAVIVENNDIGHAVCDTIWHELEYEELVNLDPKGLGVRSTKKSKKIANLLLKEYIEKEWLKLYDERTVYELSRYEEIKPGVYAAGRHENDDCVTSTLWSVYYIKSDEYDDKDYSTKQIEDKYNVNFGDFDEGEKTETNSLINNQEEGNPNFVPSVILDDEIF